MRPPSKPFSVSIERPAARVYEFLCLPDNYRRWTSGWIAETAQGPVTWSFTDLNTFGMLDFALQRPGGESVYVPLRVVAKGSGCELVLTLFRQPEMSDEEFAHAARRAKANLLAAKGLVEAQPF
jgi:hypothetical protein